MNISLMLAFMTIITLISVVENNGAEGLISCIGSISGLPGYVTASPGNKTSISGIYSYCDKPEEGASPLFITDIPSMDSLITNSNKDGKFTIEFVIPEDTETGLYNAKIFADSVPYVVFIRVADLPSPTQTYRLAIKENTFAIQWHMQTGRISHIELDVQSKSLMISLERHQSTQDYLLIKLSRDLIDEAPERFSVEVSGKKVHYQETSESKANVLVIPLSDDAGKVQIYGSYIIPESQQDLLWSFHPNATLRSVAMSQDGSHIVANAEFDINKSIVYFFSLNGTILWSHEFDRSVSSVAISDDGLFIVVIASHMETINPGATVWNRIRDAPIYAYIFDRNGNLLSSYTILDSPLSLEEERPFFNIEMSSDGSYVAMPLTGSIFYFDREGSMLWNYTIGRWVNAIEVSSDGQYVVAVGFSASPEHDLGVFLFNRYGQMLWNYTRTDVGIFDDASLTMTPDAEYIFLGIAYADTTGTLLVFNKNGELIPNDLTEIVRSIKTSEDGSLLVANSSCCDYRSLLLLDKEANVLWNYTGAEYPLAISSDDSYIVAKEWRSGSVLLFNRQGDILSQYVTGELQSFSISPDGTFIVVSARPPSVYDGDGIYVFDTSRVIPEFPFALIVLAASIAGFIASSKWIQRSNSQPKVG